MAIFHHLRVNRFTPSRRRSRLLAPSRQSVARRRYFARGANAISNVFVPIRHPRTAVPCCPVSWRSGLKIVIRQLNVRIFSRRWQTGSLRDQGTVCQCPFPASPSFRASVAERLPAAQGVCLLLIACQNACGRAEPRAGLRRVAAGPRNRCQVFIRARGCRFRSNCAGFRLRFPKVTDASGQTPWRRQANVV